MTYQELATYSNYALYSAMGILTLTMLAYAGYLAGLMPARHEQRDAARKDAAEKDAAQQDATRTEELVGASAGGRGAAGGDVAARPPETPAPRSLNEGVSGDEVRARVDDIPDVTIGRWRVEKHDGRLVIDAVLRAPSGIPFDDRLAGLAHDPALSDVRFGD